MARNLTDAVNSCLRGIGLAPVGSEDEMVLDALTAREVVEEVSETIQGKGWYFNKEFGWEITPDSDGQIKVPNDTLDIISWDTSRTADLTLRGDRVYDKVMHSFNLSDAVNRNGSISFNLIRYLPFEQLPPPARNYITYVARRQFAQDVDGDVNKWRFQNVDEEKALIALEQAERRNKKNNHFDNALLSAVITEAGGPNGRIYRQALPDFPRRRQILRGL